MNWLLISLVVVDKVVGIVSEFIWRDVFIFFYFNERVWVVLNGVLIYGNLGYGFFWLVVFVFFFVIFEFLIMVE